MRKALEQNQHPDELYERITASKNFSLFQGDFESYNQTLDVLLTSYNARKITADDVNRAILAISRIPGQPSYDVIRLAFYAKAEVSQSALMPTNPPSDDLSTLRATIDSTSQSFSKMNLTAVPRLIDLYSLFSSQKETNNKLLIARYYYALYNHNKKPDEQFLHSLLGFIDGKNSLPALDANLVGIHRTFHKIPSLIKFIDDHYQYLLEHDTKNLEALEAERPSIQTNSPPEEGSPLQMLEAKITVISQAKSTLTKMGKHPSIQQKLLAIQEHTTLMSQYSKDEKYSHLHRDPQWQRWLIMGLCIRHPSYFCWSHDL